MELISTTPFGQRPVTAGLIARAIEAQGRVQIPEFDKWALFRALCTAREAFGISDRDLAVLNALLSFHPGKMLTDTQNLIVFPSNRALSERTHGMAESTLRRHLGALSAAGLIQRHDSPNGKRYAARGHGGDVIRAFGFDLRPLLVRAQDITEAAAEAEAKAGRIRRLREEITLLKRDALKLAQYGQHSAPEPVWATYEVQLLEMHKLMRRKLSENALEDVLALLKPLLSAIYKRLETVEMDGSDSQNERHIQNSNTDKPDLESCEDEKACDPDVGTEREINVPLDLVARACPDILPYAAHPVRHWRDFVDLAHFVKGMMGITPEVWAKAVGVMGPQGTATVVAAILQRVEDIRNPGGYLQALIKKAEAGLFSPAPMIMALLNKS